LEGVTPVVPIAVPDREELRAFAERLHARGQPWKGEAFGWSAEYSPQRPEPPLDSKMLFTPADFCIGESGIWFFIADVGTRPERTAGGIPGRAESGSGRPSAGRVP
jgi:hypothetical protein